ncbi:MAG: signal peptide peptidase SppA [Gammaproteobacteria bacterium]|nr:signal peptide peptidase SppA [Gammaproteobacteria bacterium]
MSKPSLLRRVFSAIWNGITRVRLALSNILFLLMLLFIYVVYFGGAPEALPERAALLLNPVGTIVDQKSPVMPLQILAGEPSPEDNEVLLRDVIEAIEYARDDPAISSLVMELDQLAYVGISKSQEIVVALESFRESGKPIVAVGDYFSQDQYLLASHADEIIAHPMGGVVLEGFSSYRNYFRQALEKLSVNMHVFRAGEFKSAVEPFVRDDMSPGEKEVTAQWLQGLWEQYTAAVEARRKLSAGAVNDYINNFSQRLQEQGGDTAQLALQAGLVDQLLSHREANDYLVDRVGASNEEGLYEAMMFESYVSRKRPLHLPGENAGERVAVITAVGDMLPGDQPPGTIGGDSLAKLIRTTAEAEGVKAIVLRITSGGGSMFASEVIRQEILHARATGLPVVVSMGAVAASGGYYIAAEADEIWATPSSITGSIGVFAAFPTFERLLERVGVFTDGVGTTELAGALRVDRPLNPQLTAALTSGVDHAYHSFLQIVADGRDMSVEEVDALAQGRVWSAPDALDNGLVDGLGGLDDAIAAAAARAGLEDYEVEYAEKPRSPRELLLQQLTKRLGVIARWNESDIHAGLSSLWRPVREAARELSLLQDPGHLYMRCVGCAMLQ